MNLKKHPNYPLISPVYIIPEIVNTTVPTAVHLPVRTEVSTMNEISTDDPAQLRV